MARVGSDPTPHIVAHVLYCYAMEAIGRSTTLSRRYMSTP